MSVRKVATLRAIAARFVDGRLREEALAVMTDDEVEAVLTNVPGVGPWTAHGFLLIALNRPDVFLPGDVALRRAVQRAYGLDHAPTGAGVEPTGGALATVSKPRCGLLVHIRIRRASPNGLNTGGIKELEGSR
jgi:3-methyladenine DNA glycosylase/8-oxoguanine DNA glycosylase